jgi:hypothetical protein
VVVLEFCYCVYANRSFVRTILHHDQSRQWRLSTISSRIQLLPSVVGLTIPSSDCTNKVVRDQGLGGQEVYHATQHLSKDHERCLYNGWAFHDTGSTLYGAFVDSERDCFSVFDHRVPGPVLCYSKPHADYDDFTACCFLSDHALATSHVWKHNWTDLPCNSIQVWDLRNVSRTPATEHTLASFPLDSISKVECEVEWSFSEHPCVGATTLPRVANTTHHRYMTQLVPSRSTDSSTIMITFQNSEFGTELTRYDYGTFETPLPSNRNSRNHP